MSNLRRSFGAAALLGPEIVLFFYEVLLPFLLLSFSHPPRLDIRRRLQGICLRPYKFSTTFSNTLAWKPINRCLQDCWSVVGCGKVALTN